MAGLNDSGEASSAPAKRTRNVTEASGTVELVGGPTLFIGTGGTLVLDGIGDARETKTAFTVADGAQIPVRVARLYLDESDAANIVAIW